MNVERIGIKFVTLKCVVSVLKSMQGKAGLIATECVGCDRSMCSGSKSSLSSLSYVLSSGGVGSRVLESKRIT